MAGAVAEAHVERELAEKKSDDLVFKPGKAVEEFRVYAKDTRVYQHYAAMRRNQTLAFVQRMHEKWHRFDHARMTVRQAFDKLSTFVDASDPDTALPNLVHMLQTAERARAAGEPDWLVLLCLVHDLGKVMCMIGGAEEDGQGNSVGAPQFAVGGDTWVVGARIPECAVFPELNVDNPDMHDAVMSTDDGVYQRGCGIMNLTFAYGHDEYMYRMVLHNGCPFPREGLAMLRLHSCYPWHKGGAYRQFHAPGDDDLLAAVLRFNQYDLYSKGDAAPDVDALWPYYQTLVDKYMPGVLHW